MDEKTLLTVAASIITAIVAALVTVLLSERKKRREYKLQFQTQAVARTLLKNRRWRLRTFKTLKHHMAGFEDDELRKLLIQAGAIRFEDEAGVEVWGLVKRNQDRIDQEWGTARN